MITVFLGYRNQIGYLIRKPPAGQPQIVEEFSQEIGEWCEENLSGPAYPKYVHFLKPDENGNFRQYGRYEFVFSNEDDAALFKLFHVKSIA